jgi:hypothetical protein
VTESLWGDLPKASSDPHPRQILEEQARAVTEQTKGLLRGQFRQYIDSDTYHGKAASAQLCVICSAMGEYTYYVLEAEYDIVDPFPAFVSYPGLLHEGTECADASGFKEAVKAILQSPRTRRAVASLLREAQGDDIPF